MGLPAGIEGAIHAARHHWEAQASEPDYGFLMVDAKNAFNELDRNMMLYVLRYLWPQGARYVYNCYKHWSLVLYHDSTAGTAFTLYSATGVVQGCPLSMYTYALTLVPLITRLQREFPTLLHLWYADDGNAAGSFVELKLYLDRLTRLGIPYGYFVQPSKSKLLTCHPDHARTFFRPTRNGLTDISFGGQFLGGHIGTESTFLPWLTAHIDSWATNIISMTIPARFFPQSTYFGFQNPYNKSGNLFNGPALAHP